MSGETDQVKWRGVQPVDGVRGIWPARNSVRVNEFTSKTGTGPFTLYTVPANKILFINAGFMTARLAADASCRSTMFVRDDGDADVFPLVYVIFDIAGQITVPLHYSPAIEVIAGYDVYLYNSAAGLDCRGGIHGWLEDA